MNEYGRFDELLIVRKIKETVRKWWNIDLSYVNSKGDVVELEDSGIVRAQNAICRLALEEADVRGRCKSVLAEAIAEVNDNRSLRAQLFTDCHLGFQFVLAPVLDDDGAFHGAILAEGFLLESEKNERMAQIRQKAVGHGVLPENWQVALASIPVISRRDLLYLCDLLETTVEEIIEFGKVLFAKEAKIRQLTGELSGRYRFGNIVGRGSAMLQMFSLLEKIAQSDTSVLITGENGTGKELIARALHHNGPRRDKPFVAQNVSALNDNLLESEFFGHVKGAFTGATRDKLGLFKVADGGTFFLDEVGDMSPTMQVKLLRVLQEGSFLPVGATNPEEVDVRIIAATNRNLEEMVEANTFRQDLFYRLNVINVEVPPLRVRKEDIPHLVDHFLEQQSKKLNLSKKKLSKEIMARFYSYSWPGNVRELENEVERLVVLAGDEEVIEADVLEDANKFSARPQNLERFRVKGDLASAVAALERDMIEEGILRTSGNKTRLARELGVSRTTLIKKIKEYDISGI